MQSSIILISIFFMQFCHGMVIDQRTHHQRNVEATNSMETGRLLVGQTTIFVVKEGQFEKLQAAQEQEQEQQEPEQFQDVLVDSSMEDEGDQEQQPDYFFDQLDQSSEQQDEGEDLEELFQQYKQENRKEYQTEEENDFRFSVYRSNLNYINRHNARNSSYQMGQNKFTDLTIKQFQQTNLAKDSVVSGRARSTFPKIEKVNTDTGIGDFGLTAVKQIDWRKRMKQVPRIKDQGKCAACYAFAIIGAIQMNYAYYYQAKNTLFSEQQIIDCCSKQKYGCDGCTNGKMASTMKYINEVGISSISNYPYTARKQKCRQNIKKESLLFKEFPFFQLYGVQDTKDFLLRNGPVAAAIDSKGWNFYKSGVFNACPKKNFKYSHSIVLVGMKEDGTWLLKNSWGETWGERGYMWLTAGNSCGVTNYVFYPVMR